MRVLAQPRALVPCLLWLAAAGLGCPADHRGPHPAEEAREVEPDAALEADGEAAPDAEAEAEDGRTHRWSCPGDPGCETVEGPLEAAAAAVVVTPPVETFEDLAGDGAWQMGEPFTELDGDGAWTPVWLAGFAQERFAKGVHDDLYARILVLQRGALRLAVVSVDWVGLLHDHVLELEQAARDAGLGLDALVLSSTHNHEGPDTMGIWGPSFFKTGRDERYLAWARDEIVRGLTEAAGRLAPVRLFAGVGRTEGLTHDSRLPEVKDEQLVALRLQRVDDGAPVALVVHWSNHPEALGGSNRLVTADFPGPLVAALEAAAPGAVGIFWQGMVGGLMNPLHVHLTDEQGQPIADSSFEKAARLGQIVAAQALALLDASRDVTADGRLAFERKRFLVPFDNFEIGLAGQVGLFRRAVYDASWTARDIADILDPVAPFDPFIETEVLGIDIGELQIATVPGELYPEAGLEGPQGEWYYQEPLDPGADFYPTPCSTPVQARMRQGAIRVVLGLSQDELGYLVPRCQFDREAPWAYGRSDGQYGEGFCMHPDVVPILSEQLGEVLGALNAR